jgi:hypothetical protein
VQTEIEEVRASRRSWWRWWRWWPAIPLAAVAILLVIGLGLTLIRARREAKIQWATAEVAALARGVTAFRRDVGSFPPDDIALRGGWPTFDEGETLAYHLGRRFMIKTGQSFGPYVSMAAERLSDVDGDGFKEFPDPWGGAYVYSRRMPAPDENPPRFFDIASPGPDGVLGGTMVPGKDYVPAATPQGKAAEADNVTNW